MKKLILLSGLLFFTQFLFATTVTWNGGNGNWNVASNWDTGTVPTLNDHVFINQGIVNIPNGYNAWTRYVNLGSNASLYVRVYARLIIRNNAGNGIDLQGELRNRGRIYVQNIVSTFFANGRGINCSGVLRNYASGKIYVQETDTRGILIGSSGLFVNNGYVAVRNCDQSGVQIFGTFVNNATGVVKFSGSLLSGLSAPSTTANIDNHGLIHSEAESTGLSLNQGTFTNHSTGNIIVNTSAAGADGILLTFNQTFINHGQITTDVENGLVINNSVFENSATGNVFISSASDTGIELTMDGYLENEGVIKTNNITGTRAIILGSDTFLENHGIIDCLTGEIEVSSSSASLTNHSCAEIIVHDQIQNSGIWLNEGFIRTDHSGSNVNTDLFIQMGVIEDINNSFSGMSMIDFGFRLKPLTGNFTVGTPISNAIDDVNQSVNLAISNNLWYTNQSLTQSAGSYDPSNNTFTPNSNASGLDVLFMSVSDISNQCSMIGRVEFSSPIAPFNNPNPVFKIAKGSTTIAKRVLENYPNPIYGQARMAYTLTKDELINIQVVNAQGTTVMELKNGMENKGTHQLQWSARDLPPGIYFILLQHETGAETKQIVVQ